MQQARYEILIPKVDQLGTPLRDLAQYAHNFLASQIRLDTSHVENGRRVFWHGEEKPFDAYIFSAEDEPRTDSTAKQLAAYIGEVTNYDMILVSKHGKQGIQSWPIRNSQHVPGVPGELTQEDRRSGPLAGTLGVA